MKYILLPGFSIKNKEWSEEFVVEMKKRGFTFEILEWMHWGSGDVNDWDPEAEMQRLEELIDNQENVIVAKSLGTFISVLYVLSNDVKPTKLMWMGIPIHDLSEDELNMYPMMVSGIDLPIRVIQNTKDTHGTSAELKEFFVTNQVKIEVMEKDRDDHSYPYYDEVEKFLK